jgi:hypothetical protein
MRYERRRKRNSKEHKISYGCAAAAAAAGLESFRFCCCRGCLVFCFEARRFWFCCCLLLVGSALRLRERVFGCLRFFCCCLILVLRETRGGRNRFISDTV